MRSNSIKIYLGVLVLALNSACSANDVSEDDVVIDQLVALLAGEFDSERQAQEDKINGIDEDFAHGRVNRTFSLVDAPAVGDVVLVGTTSYGMSPWRFDTDEFLIWTFSIDADSKGIVMSPRRFKDIQSRIPFAHDVRKLAGFTLADLEPAISGASCEIVWLPTETGYSGETKPCRVMSTTRKEMLNWKWHYDLTAAAMWISFSGENESGEPLDGTPVGSPYRLDRISGY